MSYKVERRPDIAPNAYAIRYTFNETDWTTALVFGKDDKLSKKDVYDIILESKQQKGNEKSRVDKKDKKDKG